MPRAFTKELAAFRQGEHQDDLQDCRRDRKHVAVKGGEANSLQG